MAHKVRKRRRADALLPQDYQDFWLAIRNNGHNRSLRVHKTILRLHNTDTKLLQASNLLTMVSSGGYGLPFLT
jgi:hypothetical protein